MNSTSCSRQEVMLPREEANPWARSNVLPSHSDNIQYVLIIEPPPLLPLHSYPSPRPLPPPSSTLFPSCPTKAVVFKTPLQKQQQYSTKQTLQIMLGRTPPDLWPRVTPCVANRIDLSVWVLHTATLGKQRMGCPRPALVLVDCIAFL